MRDIEKLENTDPVSWGLALVDGLTIYCPEPTDTCGCKICVGPTSCCGSDDRTPWEDVS